MCTPEKIKCVEHLTLNETNCSKKCSGLQITSFDKESINKNTELFENMDLFNSMLLKNLQSLNDYLLPNPLTSMSNNPHKILT